ncbi:DUF6560 family protein [Butyrivibrio proteoclasticus]|uniref:DUF6560 family protein n=1 Tax=Butyrivibrio proteoclasticus TaxID=43305 RepID=UPI00047A046F|nr:DUF6560 family protein [Butyrivibrio proteoclasticus]
METCNVRVKKTDLLMSIFVCVFGIVVVGRRLMSVGVQKDRFSAIFLVVFCAVAIFTTASMLYNNIRIDGDSLVVRRLFKRTIVLSHGDITGYLKGSGTKTDYVIFYYDNKSCRLVQRNTENYDMLLLFLTKYCKEIGTKESA